MIIDRHLRERARQTHSKQARRSPLSGGIAFAVIATLSFGGALSTISTADARGAPDGFADLADQVTPAVVNISTVQTISPVSDNSPGRAPQTPFPPGSPFNEFFKRFFDQQQPGFGGPQGRGGQAPERRGAGSGFIIDPSGYVVTNNHVAGEATEIEVTMTDGTTYPAELIGRDEKTDLAVLKIDAPRSLPFVPWGNSDKTRVGDWVMAVGNPFGLGGTVTAGIVSARNRDINSGPYDDYLQVDASINRGNSGGPLFNMKGEVVGINTAIYSPTGGSVGIGFSIPANLAQSVVKQLQETGSVERGWLGVQIQQVTEEIADSIGLDTARGALVVSVQPDGPAQDAGFQAGDVITTFNGQDVEEMRDLPRIVADTKAGSRVKVDVFRDGRNRVIDVTIRPLPGTVTASLSDEEQRSSNTNEEKLALGITVQALTDEARETFGLSSDVGGVVISEVLSNAARDAGLRRGDVITKAGRADIASARDLTRAMDAARDDGKSSILLLVTRGGNERFVAVPFES